MSQRKAEQAVMENAAKCTEEPVNLKINHLRLETGFVSSTLTAWAGLFESRLTLTQG